MNNDNGLRTVPQASFRLGILGCGEQGRESRAPAAQALAADGVELVAVADTNIEAARQVATELGVPSAYPSLAAMVAEAKLDGVIVVLPPAAHISAVTFALQHGLHVLCEKPFGRNEEDARAMIRAADEAGRVLATGYQYPVAVAGSLEHVRVSRAIGTPYLVNATWLRSANGSDRGIPDRPGFWNRDGGRGAGADLDSHLLSVGLLLLGSVPVAVSAVSWNDHGKREYGNAFKVEDTLSIVVDCENGARGHFTAAWGADIAGDELEIRCLGTRGSIELPLMAGETEPEAFRPLVVEEDGELYPGALPIPTEEAFVVQQRNWVAACRGEADLLSRPEDALAVHRVLDAAYESAQHSGRQIRL